MVNYLDLTNHKEKKIIPLSDKFRGKDPHGNEISFTNYYMELNGQPFWNKRRMSFSRVHEDQWEDTILKMKMGGLILYLLIVLEPPRGRRRSIQF